MARTDAQRWNDLRADLGRPFKRRSRCPGCSAVFEPLIEKQVLCLTCAGREAQREREPSAEDTIQHEVAAEIRAAEAHDADRSVERRLETMRRDRTDRKRVARYGGERPVVRRGGGGRSNPKA